MGVDREVRSAAIAPGQNNLLSGYAATFWQETIIGGAFRERIARGAFEKSVARNDVLALWCHDMDRILGRTSSGTLRLNEDAKGLRFELDADPNTPDGQTALSTVRRRDVAGCSFGFYVVSEDWDDTGNLPLRTLREIELFEVSVTPTPAYPQTTVVAGQRGADVASAARLLRRKAEMEHLIRGIR